LIFGRFVIYVTLCRISRFDIDAEASIGIARYPGHGCNAEDLLRHAQIAMQAARKQQIMFAVYDDEMESYQLEYLTLASELRHAIESNELVVYYQPKVDISDEHIVGVEALVRWQHPEKGMIQHCCPNVVTHPPSNAL
jgi:predicted signal transduction protein with EAL and GGDEF domain